MKRIFPLILLAVAAFAQTSSYPAAVDTDATLLVTADFVQSTLASAVGTSDSTITVADGTRFAPNMAVTVCDSSITTGVMAGKCTVWEHMKVTAVNGNILTVTRAFAGTSARTHASGKAVSLAPKSVERDAMADAIKKIETALGANLSNVNNSADINRFNFTPQTPGGSLSAGANSITVSPVPPGVNSFDAYHPFRVSGGAGTAEVCTLLGGSAVAGASYGTLIISCANSHSGAWTIASATAGLQESLVYLGAAGGGVTVPVGSHPLYAEARITAPVTLSCASHAAILQTQSKTQNGIVVTLAGYTSRVVIENCHFATTGATLGGDMIQVNGIAPNSNHGTVIQKNLIEAAYNGIHMVGASGYVIDSNHIIAGENHSIWLENQIEPDNGDGAITNNRLDNSNPAKGTGIYWTSGGGVRIANNSILNHTVGMNFRVADGVATSDIMIANNNIELMPYAVNFQRLGTTGTLETVVITGNEMGLTENGFLASAGGLSRLQLVGNIVGGTDRAIYIQDTTDITIASNVVRGGNSGIRFGTGNSGYVNVVENQNTTATSKYIGSGRFVDHINGMTYAEITNGGFGPSNGSVIYCSDCTIANPTASGGTGAEVKRLNGVWVGN